MAEYTGRPAIPHRMWDAEDRRLRDQANEYNAEYWDKQALDEVLTDTGTNQIG